MTNEQLQRLTEELSTKYFNKPFLHVAFFNHRLRTTGGRYALGSHHIEINPKHLDHYGEKELISIIKHELCHYHLHIEGKGYQHKDMDFKQLLKKVGGTRHCQTLPNSRNQSRVLHLYKCKSCNMKFHRKRRFNTQRYVCGKCKGRIIKVESLSLKNH
ncbi:SprT family protein [Salipaludibacillus keqinensis]|uniref:Protein SprT-like n=1 Tax=Salipaludibacillus keqinensis TaxID=2045207 RepID=A0A323TE92_9BACI|nr:SprT family protein [Salipaludibacillus keqinensis]PYZ92127.1 SprT family protein [Salipaludibacillus keqinensis]